MHWTTDKGQATKGKQRRANDEWSEYLQVFYPRVKEKGTLREREGKTIVERRESERGRGKRKEKEKFNEGHFCPFTPKLS